MKESNIIIVRVDIFYSENILNNHGSFKSSNKWLVFRMVGVQGNSKFGVP